MTVAVTNRVFAKPRKCTRRLCVILLRGYRSDAVYCCVACKQSDYRQRNNPVNQPSCYLTAPAVTQTRHIDTNRYWVYFDTDDNLRVLVHAWSAPQARTRARFSIATLFDRKAESLGRESAATE